jgi:PIN domain nuclease of toxin-antitoxin system
VRLLLDTHAYAWWATGDRNLPETARSALEHPSAELLISAVVPWELAIKFRAGKWAGAGPILENLDEALTSKRLATLPISLDHARRAGLLAWQHRDPFDRMLAAQAQAESAALVTGDPVFCAIDVAIVW